MSFQEPRVYRDEKTGEIKAVEPRMGRVALMLLEWELYGPVWKGHLGHEAFDKETAAEWFGSRQSHSLLELKLDAARDSLRNADAWYQKKPAEYRMETVKFFAERVAELEKQLSEQGAGRRRLTRFGTKS